MAVGIECPVCEAVFLVKQASSKVGIRCPECDRKYRFSKKILAAKQPTSAKTGAEKRANRTTPVKAKAKKHSAAVAKTANADQAASGSDITLDQKSSGAVPSHLSGKIEIEDNALSKVWEIQSRKMKKTRRQTFNTMIATIVLSVVAIILGLVLYRQLSLPPTDQSASNAGSPTHQRVIDPSLLDPSLSTPQWNASTFDQPIGFDRESGESEEDESSVEIPRVLADELPEREFEYLRNGELRSVWQRFRPRLISLDVRTDLGVIQSVGTIVDSRGWALTSNQYVSKWPDVAVTASAPNIDAYYAHVDAQKQVEDSDASSTLLTDISKGVASAQPKRDHALVAVHSRFVIALDEFEYASSRKIVSGMYLVQVAPPSPTNPYGYEEVKVHGRQEFEELETEARDKANALGLDDPSASWVVTAKKASPPVGTPVFTRMGELVATHVFSTKQYAYFLMTDQVPKLITQAAVTGGERGTLKLVDAATELLSEDHLMARPSQLMNRAGVACEAFDWVPQDAEQYLQLQKFSRRFSTVAEFIRDRQDDTSESVSLSILSDQVKRWQQSFSRGIQDSSKINSKKIDQLNVFAVEKLMARSPNTANTYIPFVAEVYKVGRDANNQDSILMTIGEDQAIIKVPFSPNSGRMLPGSQWLCFYKRPRRLNRSRSKLRSDQLVPLFADGNILLVLGPIPKTSR